MVTSILHFKKTWSERWLKSDSYSSKSYGIVVSIFFLSIQRGNSYSREAMKSRNSESRRNESRRSESRNNESLTRESRTNESRVNSVCIVDRQRSLEHLLCQSVSRILTSVAVSLTVCRRSEFIYSLTLLTERG